MNFKISTLLFIVLIILMKIQIFSQRKPINFEHLTVDNGLSQNSVKCIFQDKRGFLWFGTRVGLNRFDGYNFKISHAQTGRDSISSEIVNTLYEDSYGLLWIGTIRGLDCYNTHDGKMDFYISDTNKPSSIQGNRISAIIEDQYKNIWISTDKGFCTFDRKTKRFNNYTYSTTNKSNIDENNITTLYLDKWKNLWIGAHGPMIKKANIGYDEKTGNSLITEIKTLDVPFNKRTESNVTSIIISADNYLWIATEGSGLYRIKLNEQNPGRIFEKDIIKESGTVQEFTLNKYDKTSISCNEITALLEDKRGQIWIGTNNGLNIFQKESNNFFRLMYDPLNIKSLSNNRVLSIFEDRTGNIWIGTFSAGLNIYNPKEKKFQLYRSDPYSILSLNSDLVSAVYEDKEGILWIGTRDGLNELDRKNNRSKYYVYNPADNTSLSNNVIFSICGDNFGQIWVGTQAGGLNCFNKKTKKFKRFPYDLKHGVSSNIIRALFTDKESNLWIGTNNGLNKYNIIDKTFKYYNHSNHDSSTISHNYVWSIFEDSGGNLWIGTIDGLNKYIKKTDNFQRYYNRKSTNKEDINFFCTITEDLSGQIWVGTYGSGIYKIEKKNLSDAFSGQVSPAYPFVSFDQSSLPNLTINGLLCDEYNFIWASTDRGICKINPSNGDVQTFNTKDGLQGIEFNAGAYYRNKSGEMFFGGINGLTSFFPKDIVKNEIIPPVVISSIKLFGKELPIKGMISDNEEIRISYKENFISFDFSALDFTAPSKNQYKYILEGFNDKWIECNNEHTANFTNLSGGEYTFRVIGSNNDGVWNKKGISIKLFVSPPYWDTWWFRIVIILFLSGILLLLYRFRTRSLAMQKKELESQIKIRTEELSQSVNSLRESEEKLTRAIKDKDKLFSLIAHDLKNSVGNLMSVLGYLVDRSHTISQEDFSLMMQELNKTSINTYNLLENLLEWAKSQQGLIKFEPMLGDINQVTKEIIDFFTLKAREKSITINFKPNEYNLAFFDKNMLMMIIRNLINNAIKFTDHNGKIDISIYENGNFIEFTIKDNGIGINEKLMKKLFNPSEYFSTRGTAGEEGTGLGLLLCKEFIERHNGKIWVESQLGVGTTFYFNIPKKSTG